MAATTIFNQTNVTPPVAPAEYLFPSATGFVMPANFTQWAMNIDQSNIPPSSSYRFDVEFQRSGVWTVSAYADFQGGSYKLIDGTTSFINTLSANITSDPVYPSHARIRVKSYGGWVLPSLTIVLS